MEWTFFKVPRTGLIARQPSLHRWYNWDVYGYVVLPYGAWCP
jgi:hypothetical protein